MKSNRRRIFIFVALCLVVSGFSGYAEEIKTPAEKSQFKEYSQHAAVTEFLSFMDHLSPEVSVQIVGRSLGMENYGAKDIYLCIITEEGAGSPEKLNRKKPAFLLIASQHGNEQSGKEAALQLIRDLALGELKPLLKKLNFLIIPQANPFGNSFDQRRNEQDLDLNRDHVKLESPEVEAIHRIFRQWMPEVTLDVHEKGDDFYRISTGCVSNININLALQRFSRDTVLEELRKDLEGKGIPFHEYLITQEMGIDSSAGVEYKKEDLEGKQEMKRYSTTDLNDGRNSFGIYETLSFIQEGASRHDIESLKERTHWQYYGIRFFAESIARHAEEIKSLVQNSRTELLEKARIYSQSDPVHLKMKYARDENHPTLAINKFEQAESPVRGILKVDKKAGDVLTSEDVALYPYPSELKVAEEVVKNWFPNVEPVTSVPRPLGYIIPSQYREIVELLLRHGLKVNVFIEDLPLEVEAFKAGEVIPAEYDYLPPLKIEGEAETFEVLIKKGDFHVSCFQEGSSLISCLLEPQSLYGLIRYWKFQLVPEEGDIFPFYRITNETSLPLIPYKNWKRGG